jgi:alpha-tubulin suppressor-like RCC1 family protein
LFFKVFTFGCNDEGALGRKVADEDECMSPSKVELSEKITMVSAGDSHTAALSDQGHVYIWGTFRVRYFGLEKSFHLFVCFSVLSFGVWQQCGKLMFMPVN